MNYEEYWQSPQKELTETDPLIPLKSNLIRKAYTNIPSPKILDAGCGGGALIANYISSNTNVIGIDISDKAIKLAESRNIPNAEFQTSELDKPWNFEDSQFDIVVSSEVLEHLDNFPLYMQESYRVLKPNGKLILTTPYHGLLKNLALCFWGFDKHFCNYESGHIRFFSNKKLRQLAESAGFQNIKFKSLGRIPFLAKSTVLIAEK